jgi:hypothetical protein
MCQEPELHDAACEQRHRFEGDRRVKRLAVPVVNKDTHLSMETQTQETQRHRIKGDRCVKRLAVPVTHSEQVSGLVYILWKVTK